MNLNGGVALYAFTTLCVNAVACCAIVHELSGAIAVLGCAAMLPCTALQCTALCSAVCVGCLSYVQCRAECEGKFCFRSSGGALRRALFKLERGVCTQCGLDCHDLVNKVRQAS